MGFSGPWMFNLDNTLTKEFKFGERHKVQLRMDTLNTFNHPAFWVGDQNINTPYFGGVFDTLNSPRNVQFQLKYIF